ncbi:MAG: DUF4332 domain-containing protein [Rhizonema sp. NSF051]|nr:DUF4332 domain-containing protein [Rhizonema sp. NSF051]
MSPQPKAQKSPVKSCNWSIEQLPGLSLEEKDHLKNCGITTTKALVQQGKTPASRLTLANKLQIHLQHINKWVALADLARIESVGTQYCGLLLHAGVISVAQLATIPTHKLHQQVLRLVVATMQNKDLCPKVEQVQQWTQQANILVGAGLIK